MDLHNARRILRFGRQNPIFRWATTALSKRVIQLWNLISGPRRRAWAAKRQVALHDRLVKLKVRQKKEAEAELQKFLSAGDRLHIPVSETPKVSILLVLYNQAALTFRCLQSLTVESLVPIEVIIIDNGSQDTTGEMMKQVTGVNYRLNAENLGFLMAVNQGADLACGDHLLLLNNDAALLPGSLANAVSRLEKNERYGAVGGKIILADGSLQEAGSIIWRDGSCLGYGRGRCPDEPEFQFLRIVDYCSGAFLLIRRHLFESLGRLDEDYSPAYYEESDFCLRLAETGFQVVYDPNVEILHYEFGSSASVEDAITLIRRNREKLREKHKDTLERKNNYSPLGILRARDLTPYKGRVLYIDDRVPHESLGAGFPRCRAIVHALVELGLFVTFYPLMFPTGRWGDTYKTLPHQVEVMLDYGMERLCSFLGERAGYYDYVMVSRPHNMEAIRYLYKQHPGLFKGMQVIYDAEAIFTLREARRHEVLGQFFSPRAFRKKLDNELKLADIAQHIIAVSPAEAAHFERAGYNHIHVIAHALTPTPTPAPFEKRQGLIFVGSLDYDNSPNVDSLVWFMKAVMPEIEKQRQSSIPLTAVGRAGSCQILDLKSENFILTGPVESLQPLFNSARVFVAPTRFTAGVPLKAYNAAAHGVPMVTTELIAEQLGWQNREDLLWADDPAGFAASVIELYENQELWQRLRENALEKIAQQCSDELFTTELGNIFCS